MKSCGTLKYQIKEQNKGVEGGQIFFVYYVKKCKQGEQKLQKQ